MAFVGYPTLVAPRGQRAPASVFVAKFAPQSDPPTSYDLQVTEDRTFANITHYSGVGLTAGVGDPVPRTIRAPWAGPELVIGRIYWWRLRGKVSGYTGKWPSAAMFSPDPAAAAGPYDEWARALLGTLGYPRPITLVGTLIPTGAQVKQTLGVTYLSRVQVRDDAHPPSINRIIEVLGWKMALTFMDGWAVDYVTHDVRGATGG